MISYEEFKKVEIRAGKVLSAEKIPNTDKLLKLSVDFGETKEVAPVAPIVPEGNVLTATPVAPVVSDGSVITPTEVTQSIKIPAPRQIVSGISMHFPDPTVLIGKTCMFVTNLEPRTIKGFESNGMLFAVSTPEGGFSILEPNSTIPAGTKAA